MASSTKQISYTYATSGLFNVNITLFNKVSSFSQAIQVIYNCYIYMNNKQ
jgi:hypothetical protein